MLELGGIMVDSFGVAKLSPVFCYFSVPYTVRVQVSRYLNLLKTEGVPGKIRTSILNRC